MADFLYTGLFVDFFRGVRSCKWRILTNPHLQKKRDGPPVASGSSNLRGRFMGTNTGHFCKKHQAFQRWFSINYLWETTTIQDIVMNHTLQREEINENRDGILSPDVSSEPIPIPSSPISVKMPLVSLGRASVVVANQRCTLNTWGTGARKHGIWQNNYVMWCANIYFFKNTCTWLHMHASCNICAVIPDDVCYTSVYM